MELGLYLHPWDHVHLAERGGLKALQEMGVSDVALGTAYHAGRWTTPTGSTSLLRFLEDGVVHFRPEAEYGELVPLASSLVHDDSASPLEGLLIEGAKLDLELAAWTVLFHNSRLGTAHPGSCVQNACGDVYPYALCPARPEVQEYGVALCGDVARHPRLDVLELEAAGFMGYRHGSHHDKSSVAPDARLDFLLSYCFCERCGEGLAAQGVDPGQAQERVQQLLRQGLVEADVMQPQRLSWQQAWDRLAQDLGDDVFLAMQRHRTLVYQGFLQKVREQLPPGVRLVVHVHMDPLSTGSQLGLPLSTVAGWVDEVVVTHYGQGPKQIAEMWQGQAEASVKTRIAIWPKAPQFTRDEDLDAVQQLVSDHGLAGLRIYHLGLLPWRTVERVVRRFLDT